MFRNSKKLAWIFFIFTACIAYSTTSHLAISAILKENAVRILVVHSYSQVYPWTDGQQQGFANTLKKTLKIPYEIKTEYLDTKRKSLTTSYAESFVDYLRTKYEAYSPDAIYVTDDNGLNFAVNHFSDLFPDVPIFFSGVNDYSQLHRIDKTKITGVFERKEIRPNIELLSHLVGDFNQIAIVGDGSPTYQAIETELRIELNTKVDIQATYVVGNNIQVILDALARLPKQPIILTTLGAVRNNVGDVLSLKETISKIVSSGHKIVVSMEDAYFFDGVIGGYVTSSNAQGSAAARLMSAHLLGRPVADLAPITESPNEFVLNDRMLEALQVTLPNAIADKTRLINLRTNFYDKFRQVILGSTIILSVALAMTLVLYVLTLKLKNRQLISTSRRLTEQGNELRNSERRFSNLSRLSPVGVFKTDRDGNCIYVNDRWIKFSGLSEEQALGEGWKDALHPDDRERVLGEVYESFERDGIFASEYRFLTPDGEVTWLFGQTSPEQDADGRKVGYIGTVTDITERKNLEDKNLKDQERLNQASAIAGLGYFERDLMDDTIYWSEEMYHIFGIEGARPKLSNELFMDFVHPDDSEAIKKVAKKSIEELTSQEVNFRIVRTDGSVRQVLTVMKAIRDQSGKSIKIMGTVRDVTDEKDREDQFRQSQKMEAVGQLTAGIAHDFNNMLAGILGNLELISDKDSSEEERSKRLERAESIVHRGAELTKQLLAYSRKQTLAPKPTRVDELVNNMLNLMRRTLGETIAIRTDFAENLWSAEIDPNQLENAVLNLAINARDALPSGGALFLHGHNVRIDNDTNADRLKLVAGDYIALSIRDMGKGIPADQIDKVFEPFFTTKDVSEGSGLGLSMVYGFVKQSGGSVDIESEEGKGTTVTLYLPRTMTEEAVIETQPPAPPAGKAHGERLMIIEDDPDVLDVTSAALIRMGYEVIDGGDGSEAIKIAMSQESGIDFLLTDIVLPNGHNGFDLASDIVMKWPQMKVLLMTGYAAKEVLRTTNEDFNFPLIEKPFQINDLGQKIQEILTS